jgi:hypothetical protein
MALNSEIRNSSEALDITLHFIQNQKRKTNDNEMLLRF